MAILNDEYIELGSSDSLLLLPERKKEIVKEEADLLYWYREGRHLDVEFNTLKMQCKYGRITPHAL